MSDQEETKVEEKKEEKKEEEKKEEEKKEEEKKEEKEEEKKEEEKKEEKGKSKEEKQEDLAKLVSAVRADVEVITEHDPRHPPDATALVPVKDFTELPNLKPALLQTLKESGFDRPTPVQERALPLTFLKRNIIAQAPSGTGKTITFTLSLLQNIDEKKQYPQAVVVSPTLELAHTIHSVISPFARSLGAQCQFVRKEMKEFEHKNPQVIVGTPGKLFAVFQRRSRLFLDPSRIGVFVVDEADKLLAGGLAAETKKVRSMCKNVKQTILLSATFEKNIASFALAGANPFIAGTWSIVRVVAKNNTTQLKSSIPKTIQHHLVEIKPNENKMDVLSQLFTVFQSGQTFVFANTKRDVENIHAMLTREGHHAVALSGAMSGADREEIFRQFRTLEKRILVCTNVGSRGLDIEGCTTVVNYDVPVEGEQVDVPTYVHRAGRTARMGRNGLCVTLCTNNRERTGMEKIFSQCVSTDGEEIKWGDWKMDDMDAIEEQIEKMSL